MDLVRICIMLIYRGLTKDRSRLNFYEIQDLPLFLSKRVRDASIYT